MTATVFGPLVNPQLRTVSLTAASHAARFRTAYAPSQVSWQVSATMPSAAALSTDGFNIHARAASLLSPRRIAQWATQLRKV